MKNKTLKWSLIGLAGFLVLTWVAGLLLRPEANPAHRYLGVIVSPQADPILKRACFDCHSHETVWPLYTQIPPVSLLIALDVREARRKLNFSLWDAYPPEKQRSLVKILAMEVGEKEMPPAAYLLMHANGRLTDAEIQVLAPTAPGK